jgi:undecaprenyl-diphosphatase
MSEHSRTRTGEYRFISALVALAAIWLTMLVSGRGPLDRAIYEAMYAGRKPVLAGIAHIFTALGEPTVLITVGVLMALWLWYKGHRHLPAAIIGITMVGRGLTELQKYWIARGRPDLETHLVVVKTSSFPSGHATGSMIFYLTMALVLAQGARWRRLAVAAAILMSMLVGISRVMLGVHWPSDVIGGWAFGLLWVLLTLRLAGRFVRE